MLLPFLEPGRTEAGCDEAGRGCLAGSVFAAAVILPPDFRNEELNDSKQLSERARRRLRVVIEREALAWAVGVATAEEIDGINILRASILAMHRAIAGLRLRPDFLLIDGNRFSPCPEQIPYATIVHGDARMMSIAAASVLAKTHRDEAMTALGADFPAYGWARNKGYPTAAHRDAIRRFGVTPHHRRSFSLLPEATQGEIAW